MEIILVPRNEINNSLFIGHTRQWEDYCTVEEANKFWRFSDNDTTYYIITSKHEYEIDDDEEDGELIIITDLKQREKLPHYFQEYM